MKSIGALLVVTLLGACAPEIPQDAAPAVVVVEFDPAAAIPIVPTPNDLAIDRATGHIVVPATPGESVAQREFETTYLETLTGFPFESTGQALVSGDLDPATVNPQDVLVLDLGTPSAPAAPAPVAIVPTYVAANRAVVVTPPNGVWTRAHTYAVAFVAGANGLRGANGQDVVGSETWALVSSSTPLVTCPQDLSATNCRPTVSIIPSSIPFTDQAGRLADQTAKAKQLEVLRQSYAPILDALEAKGIPRADVPIVWTFTIVDAGEVTFDPANNVVPFPNDVLRTNGKVDLPNPQTLQPLTASDCASPLDPLVAITCGLNTLDGFSTLAPPVSESSDTLGAVAQADIDPASLNTTSVGLTPVATTAPSNEATAVKFTPCLNCLATATTPQQLEWSLGAPLDEKTTYFAWVTSDVKDMQGKSVIANPVFAMLRLTNPLFDGAHATVNLLTDAQAQALEPLRLAMQPLLDKVGRSNVALAFAFTTQSEATVLDQLYTFPYSPALAAMPTTPLYLVDATAQYKARATAASIPFTAIGKVFIGVMDTPVAITGPGGTLDPTNPKIESVSFVLYLPATPAPGAGYPMAIFGHAFTRSRNDSIAIANSLAGGGHATLAADSLFHGERSSCTGSRVATGQATDDASCANPVNQKCNEDLLIGRCVARVDANRAACGPSAGDPTGDLGCTLQAQGNCLSDGKCEGGDFLRDATGLPVISGWNLLNLGNFFSTRDNFRQDVIDVSQLVRVIGAQGANSMSALSGATFDPTKLGYVGQNLGGILGALANAASPHTAHVALNATGGGLVQIILTAPAFATQRAALLDALASQGLHPGMPSFDRFIGIAQWILDPADPMNVGQRLTHSANPARAAFVQFIEGDQVIPNSASVAFVASSTPPLLSYEFTEGTDGFDAMTVPLAARDPFLLQPAPSSAGLALTAKAQTQIVEFLVTGAP